MRKVINLFICVFICFILSINVFASSPGSEDTLETTSVYEDESETEETECASSLNLCYDDYDLNIISNIVNGEVGGICGTVVLTYSDGTQLYADACILHKIHAQIVDNQVNSSMFPSTVYGCAMQCWSSAYAKTGERSSSQWKHCKEDVIEALSSYDRIPSNVFAATCDSRFAQKYNGFYLYARVDWNTGWVSGTFYYYSYGYSYYEDDEDNEEVIEEEIEEEIIEEATIEKEDNNIYYIEYEYRYVENKNSAVEDIKNNIISIIKQLFIIERNKLLFNRWFELE